MRNKIRQKYLRGSVLFVILSLNVFLFFSCEDNTKVNDLSDENYSYLNDYISPQHKWGLLNLKNEVVYEDRLDELRPFKNGYAAVNVAGKWGFLDTSLQMTVKPAYRSAWNFSSSFARVQFADGSYNYLSKSIDTVFNKNFEYAYDYFDSVSAVKVGRDSFRILNKTNYSSDILIYQDVRPAGHQYCIATKGSDEFLLNLKGGKVFPSPYEKISVLTDSTFRLKSAGKYFIKNTSGENLVNQVYSQLSIPQNGWIVAKNKSDIYVIRNYNKAKKIDDVDDLRYASYNRFVYLSEGKWGIMDTSMVRITPPKYKQLYNFSQGVAPFQQDELWGFVNIEGIELTEPKYGLILPYENGYSRVMFYEGMGIIDKYQNIVIPPANRTYRNVTANYIPFKGR